MTPIEWGVHRTKAYPNAKAAQEIHQWGQSPTQPPPPDSVAQENPSPETQTPRQCSGEPRDWANDKGARGGCTAGILLVAGVTAVRYGHH